MAGEIHHLASFNDIGILGGLTHHNVRRIAVRDTDGQLGDIIVLRIHLRFKGNIGMGLHVLVQDLVECIQLDLIAHVVHNADGDGLFGHSQRSHTQKHYEHNEQGTQFLHVEASFFL